MLLLLFISIFAFVILFTLGDFFQSLYNRICYKNEEISIIEGVILGMFFLTTILSITSLFLPSNHFFLLFFVLFSIIYWLYKKGKIQSILIGLINTFRSIPIFFKILFLLLIFSFTLIHIFGYISFDEGNYYLQNVVWNEKYPIIKGLASFEERLGFNSSFFLLLAPFTFSFILGDPQYVLHIMFTILVLSWFFKEMIISKFEVKRVTLFIIFIIFIWFFINYFWSVSNDSIIHVTIFYLIAKLYLYPDRQINKYLLYITSFVYLVTIKTFIVPFAFVMILYFVYNMIKNKDIKPLSFIIFVSVISISFWCIRNVLLSGYLIYPFHELDLFNVDWKLPKEITIKERANINYGFDRLIRPFTEFFRTIEYFPYTFPAKPLIMGVVYWGSLIPLAYIFINLINKSKKAVKKIPPALYWIFVATILEIIFFVLTSCNERFISSMLFLSIFFAIALYLKKEKYISRIWGATLILLSIAIIGLQIPRLIYIDNTSFRPSLIFVPYTVDEKSRYGKTNEGYELYELNNGVEIYLAGSKWVYDVVPAVTRLKEGEYSGRFQSYENIEARGTRVEDGFRYRTNK